jgi:hypothetical protein
MSDATRVAAGFGTEDMQARHLKLKGRAEEMDVWVKKITAQ